jgi:tetratricopeptide (TPR) repeat protein
VHSNLGVTHRRMGQWLEALAEFEQSLALRELMGDPWGIGTIHNNIGEVHRTRGEPSEAIVSYERALEVWGRIGYASGVALGLTGLGAALAEAGDPERGLMTLRDAEAKWETVGSTAYLADLHQFRASAELARGDLDAAQRAAERSRELAVTGGSAPLVAVADRILGEILVARGDRSRGLVMVRLSRDALAEIDEVPERIRADAVLARLEG